MRFGDFQRTKDQLKRLNLQLILDFMLCTQHRPYPVLKTYRDYY